MEASGRRFKSFHPDMITRTCKDCQQELPLDDLVKEPKSKYGRKQLCKVCDAIRKRNRRLENPNYYYTYTYGITFQQFTDMMDAQSGVCAICKKGRDETLSVDHDHETGKVRALLCARCNRGIGFLQDDPAIVLSAYNYLKAHKSWT